MSQQETISASALYAKSQNCKNQGPDRCHWCGEPCERIHIHDEPIAPPFLKKPTLARFPANHYVCVSCWLWRRQRITLQFHDGSWKDGQCPQNHSCLITDKEHITIKPMTKTTLEMNSCDGDMWNILLHPPLRFALSLVDDNVKNHLQKMVVNDFREIKADTMLSFTVNGNPLRWSVYELEQAIQHGPKGKEPGVQEILNRFGAYVPPPISAVKKTAGRPTENDDPNLKSIKKVVTDSSGKGK